MRAGHDINYLSRSGNMSQAGRKQTGPVLINVQIADVAAGSMNSIISILAAVNYRHETGRGQYIDVAMKCLEGKSICSTAERCTISTRPLTAVT